MKQTLINSVIVTDLTPVPLTTPDVVNIGTQADVGLEIISLVPLGARMALNIESSADRKRWKIIFALVVDHLTALKPSLIGVPGTIKATLQGQKGQWARVSVIEAKGTSTISTVSVEN